MRRALAIACVLIGALISDATAGRQLVFDVPAEGGAFEIPVYPERLTILYFPAPVTGFVHGNIEDARVLGRDHILSVTPARGSSEISLSVDCSLFRAVLLLRPVADPAEAALQVQFRDLSRRELIEAEVARQFELRRAELELRRARLDAERTELQRTRRQLDRAIEERARTLVAVGMGKRLGIERVKAATRNRDQVIVQLREIVRLGDDAYVRLSVRNRGAQIYRVEDVSLTADHIAYPARLVTPGAGKELVRVRAQGVEHGILIIPRAAALGRTTVELVLNKATPGENKLRIFLQQ